MKRYLLASIFLASPMIFVAFNIAAIGRSALPARAEDEPAEGRPIESDHETPSIGTGEIIGNHHRIEIQGTIRGEEGEGELRLDPMKSRLNEFGDRIPHPGELVTTPIKFALLDRADPGGRSRKLYTISGGGFERNGVEVRLVTEKNIPIRLVIRDRDGHTMLPLAPRDRHR